MAFVILVINSKYGLTHNRKNQPREAGVAIIAVTNERFTNSSRSSQSAEVTTRSVLFLVGHGVYFGGGLALADVHIVNAVGAHVKASVFQHNLYAGGLLDEVV